MMHRFFRRQQEWSTKAFGTGLRTKGITEHIRSELIEIEKEPLDLEEWVDVIILACDGFWRAGGTADMFMDILFRKLKKNSERNWPPPPPEDQPSFHIKED